MVKDYTLVNLFKFIPSKWNIKQKDYTLLHQLKKIGLEKRSEKKLYDVNSFNDSMNNIKERISYFKDEDNKFKMKHKKYKNITTMIKSFDTIDFIATTTSSITLSLTGIGLLAIPISTATACGFSTGKKKVYEVIKKNNK